VRKTCEQLAHERVRLGADPFRVWH